MDSNGVLQVRMMGDFSMIWEGKNIYSGTNTPDSQITRLLQVLICNRKDGVERSKLQSLIFDDSNADDTGHLLRSVIYNTQKKLEKTILPHARYIEFREGRYYWTAEIPVQIDTELFEQLCIAAEEETDPSKRLERLLEASYAYKGDFLPDQTSLSWVAGEDRRLKAIFRLNTEEAAEIMRANKDYSAMEKLGNYAISVCPLDDWELLLIEAYVFTGRLGAAQRLYERTAESYQKELGIRPTAEQADHIENLFEQADRSRYFIEDIAEDLGEYEPSQGGMYCAYPIFRGIYRLLVRSMPVNGRASWLVLCTLKVREGSVGHTHVDLSEDISEQIKAAICSSTERSDILCRFGREQYLVMLRNRTEAGCEDILGRIKENFEKGKSKDIQVTFSKHKITARDRDNAAKGGAL